MHAVNRRSGGDDDIVVVDAANAVPVQTGGGGGGSGDGNGQRAGFISHVATPEGAPAVVRHVAQGEDQMDPSPPPPPPRSIMQWLGFTRKRARAQTARTIAGGPSGDSMQVARAIAALEKEVKSGKSWRPGEMGMRLAEIEAMERAEVDGAQKRKDEIAKARLEEEVRAAAEKMGDKVSAHLAETEELMSSHGLRHPNVLPKLKELEEMVLDLYIKDPNDVTRGRHVRVMDMRKQVEAHLKKTMTDDWREKLDTRAAAIDFELKDAASMVDLPPPPPDHNEYMEIANRMAAAREVDHQEWKAANPELHRRDSEHREIHRRIGASAAKTDEMLSVLEGDEDEVDTDSLRAAAARRSRLGRLRRRVVDDDDTNDGEADEVVVTKRPRRVRVAIPD